jgi:hypothetical protein
MNASNFAVDTNIESGIEQSVETTVQAAHVELESVRFTDLRVVGGGGNVVW